MTNQGFVYPSVLCLEGTHVGYTTLRSVPWSPSFAPAKDFGVGVGGLVERSEIPVGDEKPNGSAGLRWLSLSKLSVSNHL